jgi:5-formyltetrahydrofolate cyclo-ligase
LKGFWFESHLMTKKKIIRDQIKRVLESYDRSAIEQASEVMRKRLCAGPWWREADVVLLYLSFRKEVITDPLVGAAIREGKEVGAPRVEGGTIRFYSITSIDDDCQLGGMGIREPRPGAAPIGLDALEGKRVLAIVPGRAFDRSRNRIGWGGGYYDRWIRIARSAVDTSLTAVALCFHDQLLAEIPHGPDDEPVDVIITEREVIS